MKAKMTFFREVCQALAIFLIQVERCNVLEEEGEGETRMVYKCTSHPNAQA